VHYLHKRGFLAVGASEIGLPRGRAGERCPFHRVEARGSGSEKLLRLVPVAWTAGRDKPDFEAAVGAA